MSQLKTKRKVLFANLAHSGNFILRMLSREKEKHFRLLIYMNNFFFFVNVFHSFPFFNQKNQKSNGRQFLNFKNYYQRRVNQIPNIEKYGKLSFMVRLKNDYNILICSWVKEKKNIDLKYLFITKIKMKVS